MRGMLFIMLFTMNGFGLSRTNFLIPLAIRRFVAGANSFFRPKIDLPRLEKSMQSAAGL